MNRFTIRGDLATGDGAPGDADRFAERVETLNNAGVAVGAALGMTAILHGYVADEDETLVFAFHEGPGGEDTASGVVTQKAVGVGEALALCYESTRPVRPRRLKKKKLPAPRRRK